MATYCDIEIQMEISAETERPDREVGNYRHLGHTDVVGVLAGVHCPYCREPMRRIAPGSPPLARCFRQLPNSRVFLFERVPDTHVAVGCRNCRQTFTALKEGPL